MERLLVIDDDVELCELLQEYLGGEGYEVHVVHDGMTGSDENLRDYSLVILDVMLPGMDGFEVLRTIRSSSSIPVVMLTAKGDEIDRVLGLEMGADDYLPKPFSPRELLARIRAVLRRGRSDNDQPDRIKIGDVSLIMSSRSLLLKDKPLDLTSMEFRLAEKLLKSVGKLISREELFMDVLERPYSPFDRSLDMHISNLRKKMGSHPDGSERIKTIRGEGYLYSPPLEEI